MRKRIISSSAQEPSAPGGDWLAMDELAEVELTSETPTHPVEAALRSGTTSGWRAADAGKQTIRLRFDRPLTVRRVRLVFEERERPRTQEFVLRWQAAGGGEWRDVVRQQFNFSPVGSTLEEEDFRVELPEAAALELTIVPDVSGGDARASLREFRVA